MTKKINYSELFTLANRIRKESKCSQKEAYARAKAQLMEETPNASAEHVASAGLTKDEFIKKLQAGSVKFSYRSTRGMVITTKGTLKDEMITKNRKIAGAKTPKNPAGIAYYDRIHGIYRTVLFENLVEVF